MRKAMTIGNGQLNQVSMSETANTLDCMHDQQIVLYGTAPMIVNSSGGVSRVRLTQAITKGQVREMEENENLSATGGMKYVLRRLTPTECLRLQGLPDWWCDGANGSDSAIYKMCGNGLAIPCAYDVVNRIAKEMQRTEQ